MEIAPPCFLLPILIEHCRPAFTLSLFHSLALHFVATSALTPPNTSLPPIIRPRTKMPGRLPPHPINLHYKAITLVPLCAEYATSTAFGLSSPLPASPFPVSSLIPPGSAGTIQAAKPGAQVNPIGLFPSHALLSTLQILALLSLSNMVGIWLPSRH